MFFAYKNRGRESEKKKKKGRTNEESREERVKRKEKEEDEEEKKKKQREKKNKNRRRKKIKRKRCSGCHRASQSPPLPLLAIANDSKQASPLQVILSPSPIPFPHSFPFLHAEHEQILNSKIILETLGFARVFFYVIFIKNEQVLSY